MHRTWNALSRSTLSDARPLWLSERCVRPWTVDDVGRDQIHLTVKGGKAPGEVRIDTGLHRLKPLLVDWVWQSWYKLKGKREVIKEGWERCGLEKVLDAAQQTEAMRFCMSEPTQALGKEPERYDVDTDSDSGEEDDEEADVEAEDD
jgi:hypothetical protein